VNLEGGKIKMTNLKENGVPLHLYDRTQINGNNYYFSYALYSKKNYHILHYQETMIMRFSARMVFSGSLKEKHSSNGGYSY
jgi:hypothetical protein